ncbi:MAG TPA: short-chain dehydrogenase/reductase, partial [Arthrobacter bacterium]|nr:short-chain dehydrogenase/reductase [Arthrobacter sp.]HCB60087.1 short-chain dehydrogenase/reductase [Arthrobacter sp.]
PSLLVLGKDAFNAFAAVAQAQRTELDQWQDLSLSTGIEGDQP